MPATVIDPYRGETEHEMDMLGRYIAASETGLVHVREEDKLILDEQASKIKGDFLEAAGPFIAHAYAFHQEFPMIMRYSHVTVIYSFVEYRLSTLCDELVTRNGHAETHRPQGFGSIKESKTFLTKVVDAKITQWDELDELAKLRNCIVHCNGFIDKHRATLEIERIVRRNDGLKLSDQRRLLIEGTYVQKISQEIRDLFTMAFKNLHFGSGFYFSRFPAEAGMIFDKRTKKVKIISPESPEPT